MHDAGTKIAAHLRQRLKMVHQAIYQSAGERARSGVDRQSRWLVDRDHRRIFIKNLDGKILGGGLEWRRLGGGDLDLLAGVQKVRGLCAGAIHQHAAFFDPGL